MTTQCPHCHATFAIDPGLDLTATPCPRCSHSLAKADPSATIQLVPRPAAPAPSPPLPTRTFPKTYTIRRWQFWTLAGLPLLLFILALSPHLIPKPVSPPSQRPGTAPSNPANPATALAPAKPSAEPKLPGWGPWPTAANLFRGLGTPTIAPPSSVCSETGRTHTLAIGQRSTLVYDQALACMTIYPCDTAAARTLIPTFCRNMIQWEPRAVKIGMGTDSYNQIKHVDPFAFNSSGKQPWDFGGNLPKMHTSWCPKHYEIMFLRTNPDQLAGRHKAHDTGIRQ